MRPPSSLAAVNFARRGLHRNVNLPRPRWRRALPTRIEARLKIQACVGAADRSQASSKKPLATGRPACRSFDALLHGRDVKRPAPVPLSSVLPANRCIFRVSDAGFEPAASAV